MVSNDYECQLACLTEQQCVTVNFHQSYNQCELFRGKQGINENLLSSPGTIIMIVIDGTRMRPVNYLHVASSLDIYWAELHKVSVKVSNTNNSIYNAIVLSYVGVRAIEIPIFQDSTKLNTNTFLGLNNKMFF
ncbi:unnamed protein product [Rotaria sordida]|uniref:Apple domain-containing protein n=2 Tax=Rotaria sordida TaxID=392033 RepID=A0A819WCG4_9BILA|nr:unnamed protein product [Rotaria sordida]